MGQFVRVAAVAELPPGQGKVVEIQGKKIALFQMNGAIHAIDDTCTHRGGPLSEGQVADNVVTCPWHGAQFDILTGQALRPPARTAVARYNVRVTGSDVEVEV